MTLCAGPSASAAAPYLTHVRDAYRCVCVCVCIFGGENSENMGRSERKLKGKECERRLSASVMNSLSAFVHG